MRMADNIAALSSYVSGVSLWKTYCICMLLCVRLMEAVGHRLKEGVGRAHG